MGPFDGAQGPVSSFPRGPDARRKGKREGEATRDLSIESWRIFTEPPFRATSLPGYMHAGPACQLSACNEGPVCARTHPKCVLRTYTRSTREHSQRHARPTLHLLCIYTTWLWAWSHGTQPWREHKRGKEGERRDEGARRGGSTGPRHATFGFIVVYPAAARFPRLQIFCVSRTAFAWLCLSLLLFARLRLALDVADGGSKRADLGLVMNL